MDEADYIEKPCDKNNVSITRDDARLITLQCRQAHSIKSELD